MTTTPTIQPGTAPLQVIPENDRSASRRRRTDNRILAAFSGPSVLWYLIFTIGPLIAIFVISLLRWGGFLATPSWAGLDNYTRMFTDSVFQQAVRNSALQVIVVVVVMMPLSFMLGYYLTLKPRGHHVLRVVLFTPALMSLSAMGTVFYAIFQPTGMVNSALDAVGLGSLATPWLANPKTALWAVIAVSLWSGIGYTAVLFAARLTAISPEVYEAAAIDGAGTWRRMWGIAFPIIKDYFGVLTMLQFLWNLFASAGVVLLLTRGGPGSSSTTLSYLVYEKAFVQSQVGYSQAVGVFLFFIGVIGLVSIRRAFRQNY
ncbi:carbohydrate ABC transporter membrane protein 1, CUT1 family [Sanguibacter gelidistatuariae]|uniref:Carbohydrate ABC transporter membrane protein 1, CUT1 family n=1 Tax=Sanguibacter gelidistatuariae TaxID=1814289 RepID=A0A1G6GVA1_9MICO|nr:sugar ABC transporter permease [Sanguibacter gelidistatuariae]SDB85861.1 carbohydrate ABC transporter membrane protein 1, CUT1 family [Sanguibacter gelidistatuariae]